MIALYIILGVLVVFIIPHFFMVYLVLKSFFGRQSAEKIRNNQKKSKEYIPYVDKLFGDRDELLTHPYEEVDILSFDNLNLHGYVFKGINNKTIIMFHGVHCVGLDAFGVIGLEALKRGYNVVIINQRAHELSGGRYITYGVKEQKDVLDWIDYADKELKSEEIYLYGISMGGAAIALASDSITNNKVKALVIDSAYSSLDGLFDHLNKTRHIPAFFFAFWVKLYLKMVEGFTFSECQVIDHLSNNKIPTLFVQGTEDDVVTNEFLMNNYNNCVSYKEMLLIEGATHTLAMVVGQEPAFNKLFSFLEGASNNE